MSTAVGGSSASRVMTACSSPSPAVVRWTWLACRPAGHGDVEQLTGLIPGRDGVAGVGGDALGAVHGGGVAQRHVLGDVGGGQGDVAAGVVVDDVQRAGLADVFHDPAVAVLDPVVRADRDLAVVLAGDDRVPG